VPLIEAAGDSLSTALAAARAGADRLELCADLAVGGLTPPTDLLDEVKARVTIPVFVLIRSRPGDFIYGRIERAEMERAIDQACRLGADGLVLGALTPSGEIDAPALRRLVRRCGHRPVTFHRAFDALAPAARVAALSILARSGVRRVLTSGGAATAFDGRAAIAELVGRAPAGLGIVAAGGIRGESVVELVRATRVTEVHLAATDVGRFASVVAALRSGG
jgi:copper homeostasis protein